MIGVEVIDELLVFSRAVRRIENKVPAFFVKKMESVETLDVSNRPGKKRSSWRIISLGFHPICRKVKTLGQRSIQTFGPISSYLCH